MHLYWVATKPGGHYLSNLCRSWADALDNFHPVLLVTTGADALQRGAADVVDRLRAAHPRLGDFDIYLAGPQPFVDGVAALLARHGFPQEQLTATIP